jgi:hypothetical protein
MRDTIDMARGEYGYMLTKAAARIRARGRADESAQKQSQVHKNAQIDNKKRIKVFDDRGTKVKEKNT